MEEIEEQPKLINHSVKWGIIYGGVSILVGILLYVIRYETLVELKYLLLAIIMGLGFAIYAGIDYRKSVGGYLGYWKGYLHGLILFAVSGALYTVYNILLYNVIDPGLPQILIDVSIDNVRAMMERFGAQEADIEKALEQAKTDAAGRMTIFGLVKGYMIGLIIYGFIALITAIFVKKNVPEEPS